MNRTVLICKKYEHGLSEEESRELQMLNHLADCDNSRYSTKEWELLKEAEDLVKELAIIRGRHEH